MFIKDGATEEDIIKEDYNKFAEIEENMYCEGFDWVWDVCE